MDDPRYFGKFWMGGHDHYRSIFFVWPISSPIIDIDTKLSGYDPCGLPSMNNIMDDPVIHVSGQVGGHDPYFFV